MFALWSRWISAGRYPCNFGQWLGVFQDISGHFRTFRSISEIFTCPVQRVEDVAAWKNEPVHAIQLIQKSYKPGTSVPRNQDFTPKSDYEHDTGQQKFQILDVFRRFVNMFHDVSEYHGKRLVQTIQEKHDHAGRFVSSERLAETRSPDSSQTREQTTPESVTELNRKENSMIPSEGFSPQQLWCS